MRLSIDGLRHDDLRELARETPVIGCRAERPIETRRRNFERIALVDRVFDVQNCAQIAADELEIVDGRRCVRAALPFGLIRPGGASIERHIDEDSQHPADRLAPELHIENLEIV